MGARAAWLIQRCSIRSSSPEDFSSSIALETHGVSELSLARSAPHRSPPGALNWPITVASGQSFTTFRAADWLWLLLFVVGAQGGHLVLAWAHPRVDVTLSSLLMLGEPPVSAVAALVVLGQSVTALEILGGMVAILAVGMVASRATVAAESLDSTAVAPP